MSATSTFLDRVATAPISWGVCEVPGWGHQLSPDRVLAEMSSLGFTKTELGSTGWLPENTAELRSILARHDMSLLAAFIPLVLHDPEQADRTRAEAVATAELLADSGARYFNTAPVTSTDWQPRRPVTGAEWAHLYQMIAEIGKICAEHNLLQVIHEHVGCVVETADEVQAVIDNTDAALVVDTGHLAIGGCDPVELVKHHADRVGLVHLKDTDLAVAARLNDKQLTLMEAVQEGLFTPLGRGDLDVAGLITSLEDGGYDGWYVIEQDCAITGDLPAEGEGPIRDVETSVDFLKALATSL
ncbi:MAG: sugar phosphate isomerase/epimerase [Acidimicrobiia bacterium]|nr:sugar phosphate isomerase/epimerase [Acidimicrobiia bacterium]